MSYYDDVRDFHIRFGLPYREKPAMLSADLLAFRGGFLLEELAEFFEACGRPEVATTLKTVALALKRYETEPFGTDLEKAADALADLTYVVLGTALFMGLPFEDIWSEVQRANMAKVRASGANDPLSKRRHASDVVKPPGWTPPDHGPAIAVAIGRSNG